MSELKEVAPAFVEMAHRIVWCSAATVDTRGRPRSRIASAILQVTFCVVAAGALFIVLFKYVLSPVLS